MSHTRDDVVRMALRVLDEYGLADLSMRRLAAELDVRPSALYHHVANKQTLLALVADELLRRTFRPALPADADWRATLVSTARALRESMLAYRDGAELVSTVVAFGLGAAAPHDALVEALGDAALPASLVRTAAGTVLHYVLGHTLAEQTHLQADAAGALGDAPPARPSDFAEGLALIVDGIGVRLSGRAG
ncbi:TetR/AcrR family transcriptional regulator C-terminal domain-containing protein [Nocardioides acrostichi]|uniref:TetR/AcrR family transcriptional regulator C-terminal domain-containing protein n=1 Tax=Nocardioides acrostichi TaxID=2784339 RepID=A0A930UXV0_9ACTN|nr:TetR/AcrR family transcriptional regulator C-terminal domain-containing protein [Nocardioides acrostichi]MBF4160394.1 TetR/AcrR family transcriptional regulator C-terminal domain-containing protein [Nocardioides acrostichi]